MIKNTRKGFTITELVIVIAVIAILAAVLIPTFSSIIKKANGSAVTQETRNAVNVLLAETDAQIPDNTYVVYSKGETTKWFKYDGGKLVDAAAQTADANDVKYAKQATTDIIKIGDAGVEATALADLTENVEILVVK